MLLVHLPFPLILLTILPIWVWIRLRKFNRSPHTSLYRELLVHLFFIYGAALFIATMRPFYFQISWLGPRGSITFDVHLFEEMRNMAIGSEMLQLYYFIGNVAMLVPFGFLLPLLYPFARHFFITTLLGFSLSLSIELTQMLFTLTRRGTVDDLVFNTIGAMLGYVLFRIIYDKGLLRKKK